MHCGRCGSINVVRTRSSAVDKVVRLFSGRKRVTCKRCLWSARVRWDHDDRYVPAVPVMRAVETPSAKARAVATFQDEFDINQFH